MQLRKYVKETKLSPVNNLAINQESIYYQNDPDFVNQAADAVDDVMSAADNGNGALKSGYGKTTLTALENLFTKRFGVRCIIGYNDWNNAFAYLNYNGIEYEKYDSDYINLQKEIEKYQSSASKDSFNKMVENELTDEDVDKSKIRDFGHLNDGAFGQMMYVSYSNFLKKVSNGGLKMNLKTATIENIDKNTFFYVSLDFSRFYNNGMSSKQVLAIMLHEFGHQWNELERTYNVFSNVMLLNDILIEEYHKKNKTAVEAINIFYKESGVKENDKTSSNTVADLSLAAYKNIVRGSQEGLVTDHARTNHEQLADDFAVRFGLGAELASGLDTIGVTSQFDERHNIVVDMSFFFLAGIMSIGAPIAAPVLIPLGIMLTIGNTIYRSFSYYKQGTLYDTYERRLKRIRNGMVRNLKDVNAPVVKTYMVKDIARLDKHMIKIRDAIKSPVSKKLGEFLGGIFDKKGKQEMLLNEVIEDMNANELNVSAAQWSSLKRT